MCGEMQFEGAFDAGNARVSCSESSTSTKRVTPGATWKVRATIALPANKYSAFQHMVIGVEASCFFSMATVKKYSTLQYMVVVMEIFFFSVNVDIFHFSVYYRLLSVLGVKRCC